MWSSVEKLLKIYFPCLTSCDARLKVAQGTFYFVLRVLHFVALNGNSVEGNDFSIAANQNFFRQKILPILNYLGKILKTPSNFKYFENAAVHTLSTAALTGKIFFETQTRNALALN